MSKEPGESIGCLIWIIILFALAFLFSGEPDLWDKLHEKAMASVEQQKCAP